MHNYYINQVIYIDIALLFIAAILSIMILLYALLKEAAARRRTRSLVNIKNNVYKFIIAGTGDSAGTCPAFSGNPTTEQFLDIAMNRESVFFNKSEQDIFSSCLAAPDKIKTMEKRALKARNKWRRIEAILGLSYLDDKNAPAIFERSLLSKDDDVRYFSVIALGNMKNESSSRILVDLIRKGAFSKRKIVSVLESFSPDITSNYAIPLLKDDDPDVRFWALKLLSRLDPGKYIPEISALAADPSDEVRSAACECIGNSKDEKASEILVNALKDESWLVRSSAVRAMSILIGDKSIPKIIGLLKDNSLIVLSSVREVLVAHIATAMPYIEKILSGDDRLAKIMCKEAIEEAKKGKAR